MKLPPRTIDAFAKNPPADMLAVLVYGPDEGLVRERMASLTRSVTPDINDPFNVVEFSGSQLSENPSRLLDEAQSISMLGGRRVVRLRDAAAGQAGIIKEALSQLRPGDNLILIEGGDMPPRDALRALFEAAPNAAALPCYVDDARDISRVIADALKAQGYNIPSEALAYMAANVVGDRAVARGEVEKLVTYMGGAQKSIAIEDVIACVGNSASLSLDDLAKHAASGNFADADRVLRFVLSEGTAGVAVLRNLQNYFTRLYLTRARLDKGESIDTATAKLRPPLFFKNKPAFESQALAWFSPQIEQVMTLLMAAEGKCKQTGNDPDILCSRAVLSISQMASKAMNARRRA